MLHVDIFGNLIEVGDVVKRIRNGDCYTTTVAAIRPSGIGLNRIGWDWSKKDNQGNAIRNSKYLGRTNPLWINRYQIFYQIINLSKLDNSKIQETIKSFLNEI